MKYSYDFMDQHKDLTQTKKAELAGVSRQTIWAWDKKYKREKPLIEATKNAERLRKLEWAIDILIEGHNADSLNELAEKEREEFIEGFDRAS